MNKLFLKLSAGLLLIMLFSSCGNKTAANSDEEVVDTLTIVDTDDSLIPPSSTPQIVKINKSPDRLTKNGETYTVTLQTNKAENTEFSLDGEHWQKENVFQQVEGGKKYTFHVRNRKDNSLKDSKEMFFEAYNNVPLPTKEQLNNYLKQVADYDDAAIDALRKCLGNDCPVRGAENIRDLRQLIMETQNGASFSVSDIEVEGGAVKAIRVAREN